MMSMILGLLAYAMAPQATDTAPAEPPQAAAFKAEVTEAARAWLALGDAGQWEAGWRGTCDSFRQANALEVWMQVSQKVRVPLGAMLSREAISHDSVPAGPAGVEVVKFRTDFAARKGAIETVSLAREDGTWRVCGIYLE